MQHDTTTPSRVAGFANKLFPDSALPYDVDDVFAKLKGKNVYYGRKLRWRGWPKSTISEGGHNVIQFLNKLADTVCTVSGLKPRSRHFSFSGKEDGTPHIVVRDIDESQPRRRRFRKNMYSEHEDYDYDYFLACGFATSRLYRDRHEEPIKMSNCIKHTLRYHHMRRYLISFEIWDSTFNVMLHNHVGSVESGPISIHKNPREFLKVITGLLLCDEARLGFDPTVTHDSIMVKNMPSSQQPRRGSFPEYKKLCVAYGLSYGKHNGTYILLCENAELGNYKGNFVIKDFWSKSDDVFEGLPREVYINNCLKDFEGVPHMISYEYVKVDGKPGDLPVKGFKEITKHVRMVMDQYGFPIQEFGSRQELILAFKDFTNTIVRLYVEKRILHRDISLANLLLGEKGWTAGQRRKGLIIDFDRSIQIHTFPQDDFTSIQGTYRYMACERLEACEDDALFNAGHRAYHDLESLFYVLLWLCTRFDGPQKNIGRDIEGTFWKDWEPKDDSSFSVKESGRLKAEVMKNKKMFEYKVLSEVRPYFMPLKGCLRDLRGILFGNYIDHMDPQYAVQSANLRLFEKRMVAVFDKALFGPLQDAERLPTEVGIFVPYPIAEGRKGPARGRNRDNSEVPDNLPGPPPSPGGVRVDHEKDDSQIKEADVHSKKRTRNEFEGDSGKENQQSTPSRARKKSKPSSNT